MSKPKTGPTSFGYQRKGGILVKDPLEAPIRHRIFELFAKHQRKKTVAEILNAEGARTRNGAHFTGQTISRLLQDEQVVGIPGEIEELVPKELFELCQTILTAQSRDGGAKRKVVHLFAGLTFCACGQKMYVPSNAEKYICTDCRTKIPTDDLEAIFWSQFSTYKLPETEKNIHGNTERDWTKLPFPTKREIIECVTQRIEIGDKSITCSLVIL
ncbi:MAG: hypothetical protein CML99_07245 [Rhodobiaceae bacterium]|nr:hypothetical protein [Rhodobiaceae bacterium]|tara:strand:+ start:237 stop:878 length:642 start_codon:yes stop_codon:yes gene_type:complete